MTLPEPDIKIVPGPIPEGSILLISGVDTTVDTETGYDPMQAAGEVIELVCGHRKFAVIYAPAGNADVEVWGPDTDLKARIEELLVARDLKRVAELAVSRPEFRYRAVRGPAVTDHPQRPDLPRWHGVAVFDVDRALCGLTVDPERVTDLPFSLRDPAGEKTGIICGPCADALRSVLSRHRHGADGSCGWCHRCGAYIGSDTGACPGCGAVDVEG